MYRKILVGYDDGDQAKDALALGKQLAEATGAELVVAGVFRFDPLWAGFDSHFRDGEIEFARKIEAAAKAVSAEAEAIPSSSPARGLHELADEIGADLILVGSAHHGRIGQILAGSVGVSLLHGSPCAVGIAPHGYRERGQDGIGAVAVGFDGSAESGLALVAAGELASDIGREAQARHGRRAARPAIGKGGDAGRQELMEAIEEQARAPAHRGPRQRSGGHRGRSHARQRRPGESLSSAAQAPGTLLVLGSRAYGPLRGVLLGSVSRQLVRTAPCPLIVTPRGIHAGSDPSKPVEVEADS